MDILLPSNSLFFLPFLFFLSLTTRSTETCSSNYCGSSIFPIHFPFKLRGDYQSESCGYPGFEVFCGGKTKNQTLINLTNAGVFVVKNISYTDHKLWINDPDDCLPKRYLLQPTMDLAGSPFQLSNDLRLVNVTFLKCSNKDFQSYYPIVPIQCLSSVNTSLVAMASEPEPFFPTPFPLPTECQVISSALVPFDVFGYELYWTGQFFSDIELQWTKPSCGYPECEEDLKKGKYALGLGLGIPAGGILCFIMVSYLVYKTKTRANQEQVEAENTGSNNNQQQPSIAAEAAAAIMVVNEVNIERYPKTQVEDNGELPNPNDNVCSICLCEYQPKETLRTIPDCNHYFHAHCLEGWLKINASCPLCRNLPKSSFSLSSSTS